VVPGYDLGIQVLVMAALRIRCTLPAKRVLEQCFRDHRGAVVALSYSRRDGDLRRKWYVGYYESKQPPEMGEYCDVDGLHIFFPQGFMLKSLRGKTVALSGDGFVIR